MDNWIQECKDLALEYQEKYGLHPSAPLALIMHVTGEGKYPIENNPFGLMGVSIHGSIEKKYYDTAIYWRYSSTISLRKYESIRECFQDFLVLIQRIFPDAWTVRKDPKLFGRCLKTKNFTWSLDPDFSFKYQKLVQIY